MQSAAAAIDRLCDPSAEVSAHFVISNQGVITGLVDETQRAWHAGVGAWGGITDVNSHSIGIELANSGAQPFAYPQMRALIGLLTDLRKRWGISKFGIIGHSDMAVMRKFDPGPKFDWRALAFAGHSVWPRQLPPVLPDKQAFWSAARAFGYIWDQGQETAVLRAFRTRFRPMAQGPLDAMDAALACDLAAQIGVKHRL